MPRLGQRIKHRKPPHTKPKSQAAHNPADHPLANNPLSRYMEEHFEWMLVTGYSADTVRARRQALRRFIAWADERGLNDPREITRPILERYQRYLFYYRKDDGRPLTVGMQGQYLAPLKTWFKWLSRQNHILANPAADLDLPKQPKCLPRSVPSVEEVGAILREADPATARTKRPRPAGNPLRHRLKADGTAGRGAIRCRSQPGPALGAARQGQSPARGAAG